MFAAFVVWHSLTSVCVKHAGTGENGLSVMFEIKASHNDTEMVTEIKGCFSSRGAVCRM